MRLALASLDRRFKDVCVLPIVIAELEGERGIIGLSTTREAWFVQISQIHTRYGSHIFCRGAYDGTWHFLCCG